MPRPNGSAESDALLHAGRTGGYREILLAYDGSPGTRSALGRTAAVALPGTRVTIITVVPTRPIGSSVDPKQLDWQSRLLTEASTFLREQGLHPFIEAAVGNPERAILETAQALDVDLVVLGDGDAQRWRQLLQGIECDVLLVTGRDDAVSE